MVAGAMALLSQFDLFTYRYELEVLVLVKEIFHWRIFIYFLFDLIQDFIIKVVSTLTDDSFQVRIQVCLILSSIIN